MRSSRLILSVPVAIGAVLGVSAASAADLAVKVPIAPVAMSAYSWAGFYIGGNVGYSWGRAVSNLHAVPHTGLCLLRYLDAERRDRRHPGRLQLAGLAELGVRAGGRLAGLRRKGSPFLFQRIQFHRAAA